MSETNHNHHILEKELDWFRQIVLFREADPSSKKPFQEITSVPDLSFAQEAHYVKIVNRLKLTTSGRIALLLALARAVNDESLFSIQDLLSMQNPDQATQAKEGDEEEPKRLKMDNVFLAKKLIGGHLHTETRTFIPTLKTLLFLLCGNNKIAQQEALLHFHSRHSLFLEGIIEMHPLGAPQQGDRVVQDWINHQIFLNPSYLRYFLGGAVPQPEDDLNLPIRLLDSGLTLDNLVLPGKVLSQLQPAIHFIEHGKVFFQTEGIRSKFKEGFVMLLYGPPGTGKTLTASALGNTLGIKTYQLEVSQVISKYIGETSQNMEKVFAELERAIQWLEGQMCILFIDEADAVMGKRSAVKDSKDRYANMDVSFLLQRLEKFPGLLILATNYERNLDEAFGRRIQTYLHIPLPNEEQRKHLWKSILPQVYTYESPNIPGILARQFALTGGHIQNILKQACLHAASDKITTLEFNRHLEPYIKSEYIKKNNAYNPPRNILTLLKLSPEEYSQYTYWTDALPEKMAFMPSRLPEYLGKCIQLSKNEVATLVKQVVPTQETAQKGNISFDQLITALKTHCEDHDLDWHQVAAALNGFIGNMATPPTVPEVEKEEESPEVEKEPMPDDINTFHEPPPPRPQENELHQPEPPTPGSTAYTPPPAAPEYTFDGERVILNAEAATSYWLRFLPQGFVYSRQETPKNLGRFYGLTEQEIMITLQLAANAAENDRTNYIEFTPHVSDNLEVLRNKLGKSTLYRDEFASM